MNKTRAIVNLAAVRAFNQKQSSIFSIFFGQKGRFFTTDKVFEKVGAQLTADNEDTSEEGVDKAEKAAKALITKTINAMVDANIIEQKADQAASDPKEFKMQEYDIKDLKENQQVQIGGKEHTTLTANATTVWYNGDVILYMCHPLSPEYKAGQRIGTATLKDFHVNEEGFLYGIVTKPVMVEGEKAKTCAVKLSQAQLLDEAIPEGAKECVKYKQKAGLTKPTLVPVGDISKGVHLLSFNAVWSPEGVQMDQILEGLEDSPLKGKYTRHIVNTDHQVDECKTYNIRTAPTLILVKDGAEVARMEGLPNAEDVNAAIYTFIKKVADPKAKAPKAPKAEASEEEAK